ncbi:MAG TPA: quinolinate synthase [Clostridiales bacterium]|nr:quinolinate synthase [Clostridiales bacterium]
MAALVDSIHKLRKEKQAVIVAHSYQPDEIQEIADVVGDSYLLSRFCADDPRRIIVFCGVHFMAESAYILSPHKTVLLPEADAGCPMADMADAEDLKAARKKYPDAKVVTYINSTAEVKAESDVCCTSSNAVKIVRAMESREILFVPDMNLARWVAEQVPEKHMIPWQGFCPTHHRITGDETRKARQLHPNAVVLVHPECRKEVTDLADFVGSTQQIIDYARKSDAREFIIGTEMGILYRLKKDSPDKTFYMLRSGVVCPNMKKISLTSVYTALSETKHVITVPEEIRIRAVKSLERMLALAGG